MRCLFHWGALTFDIVPLLSALRPCPVECAPHEQFRTDVRLTTMILVLGSSRLRYSTEVSLKPSIIWCFCSTRVLSRLRIWILTLGFHLAFELWHLTLILCSLPTAYFLVPTVVRLTPYALRLLPVVLQIPLHKPPNPFLNRNARRIPEILGQIFHIRPRGRDVARLHRQEVLFRFFAE